MPTVYVASWIASSDFRNNVAFGPRPGLRGDWDSLREARLKELEFVQFGSWPSGVVCSDHSERTIERVKEVALTRNHALYAPKGEWHLVGRDWREDGRGRETWAYRAKRGKPLADVTASLGDVAEVPQTVLSIQLGIAPM